MDAVVLSFGEVEAIEVSAKETAEGEKSRITYTVSSGKSTFFVGEEDIADNGFSFPILLLKELEDRITAQTETPQE